MPIHSRLLAAFLVICLSAGSFGEGDTVYWCTAKGKRTAQDFPCGSDPTISRRGRQEVTPEMKAQRDALTEDQVKKAPSDGRDRSRTDSPSGSPTRADPRDGSTVGCMRATIQEPQPFLGTAEEIIVLSDGSVWKDMSYKYLYLYAYFPIVTICPGLGMMTLETAGQKHVFSVSRIK
jgi:hypothetical protein